MNILAAISPLYDLMTGGKGGALAGAGMALGIGGLGGGMGSPLQSGVPTQGLPQLQSQMQPIAKKAAAFQPNETEGQRRSRLLAAALGGYNASA